MPNVDGLIMKVIRNLFYYLTLPILCTWNISGKENQLNHTFTSRCFCNFLDNDFSLIQFTSEGGNDFPLSNPKTCILAFAGSSLQPLIIWLHWDITFTYCACQLVISLTYCGSSAIQENRNFIKTQNHIFAL